MKHTLQPPQALAATERATERGPSASSLMAQTCLDPLETVYWLQGIPLTVVMRLKGQASELHRRVASHQSHTHAERVGSRICFAQSCTEQCIQIYRISARHRLSACSLDCSRSNVKALIGRSSRAGKLPASDVKLPEPGLLRGSRCKQRVPQCRSESRRHRRNDPVCAREAELVFLVMLMAPLTRQMASTSNLQYCHQDHHINPSPQLSKYR